MKNKLSFFTELLLMFVVFVGLIGEIFTLSGWKFWIELIVLLGLGTFAIIALMLAFNNIKAGYSLISLISAVALADFLLFYFARGMGTILFISIIAAITAFVVGIANIREKRMPPAPAPKEKPVVKTYTPGKVVASKSGSTYHVPKCDWAKRIKKKNQVWFDSDSEAKKEGLKAHDCAK